MSFDKSHKAQSLRSFIPLYVSVDDYPLLTPSPSIPPKTIEKKITIPLFIPAHVISLIRLENIIKIGTQSGMEDPKPKPNHLLETGLDAHICIHQINQFRCFVPKSNYTYFAPNK